MRVLYRLLGGLLLTIACLSAQAAATRIEIDSYGPLQGSDPFAVGVPWGVLSTTVFNAGDGNFSLSNPYPGNSDYVDSVAVWFDAFSQFPNPTPWIRLEFSTDRLGVPLDVGVYENAQRFPFNVDGHPGLDYANSGHGFNTIDGRFQIFDATRDAQGDIISFAASFEIFGYPAPHPSPLVGGRVWYNSDAVMSSVPEPGTLLMAMLSLGCMTVAMRSRRQ